MSGIVLIVDDEQELVQSLAWNLEREGYQVRTAITGAQALEQARKEPRPDLIVLDLMLPDLPGTEVCRRLRAEASLREVAIIMVTARDEEIDRVVGFEVGADDYVTKPFSTRELVLRIRAVMRRARPTVAETERVVFGRLRVDPAAHLTWVDGVEVPLTALEFKLLAYLMARRGRVQARETLLDEVWGITAGVTTRTVDTHVKRLRQKLGPAGEYVETRRGFGYRFRQHPPKSDEAAG
jgi:two-component system, OmpR family, phosphate regulon response regulator PhoB